MQRKRGTLFISLTLLLSFGGLLSAPSEASAQTLLRTSAGKLFFDDFNRQSLGADYVPAGVGSSGWSVANNRLRYVSGAASGQAYLRPKSVSIGADAIYDFTFRSSSTTAVAPRFLVERPDTSSYYLFDTGHFREVSIAKRAGGLTTRLAAAPFATTTNRDYRAKIRVGAGGTSAVRAWVDETGVAAGDDPTPLTGRGGLSFQVGNFAAGSTVEFDSLAVYRSTRLTLNGSFGSWALYRNGGTATIGSCNTASVVDYAAVTSFPADYQNGSAAVIKAFPVGVTNCSGAPAATYTGTKGSEIFGGDAYEVPASPPPAGDAVTDDFERDTLGPNWAVHKGFGGIVNRSDLGITSQSAQPIVAWAGSPLSSDQFSEAQISGDKNPNMLAQVFARQRSGDGARYGFHYDSDNGVNFWKLKYDGVPTSQTRTIASNTTAPPPKLGDTIRIEAVGFNPVRLRGYVNGALVVSGTDSTSTAIASGPPGMAYRFRDGSSTNYPTPVFERWRGGSLP